MRALLLSDDAYEFLGEVFQRAQESGLIQVSELGIAAHTWETMAAAKLVDAEALRAKVEAPATPAEPEAPKAPRPEPKKR